jgi:hypothetical protein
MPGYLWSLGDKNKPGTVRFLIPEIFMGYFSAKGHTLYGRSFQKRFSCPNFSWNNVIAVVYCGKIRIELALF